MSILRIDTIRIGYYYNKEIHCLYGEIQKRASGEKTPTFVFQLYQKRKYVLRGQNSIEPDTTTISRSTREGRLKVGDTFPLDV